MNQVKRTLCVILLAAVLLVLPACDTIQALVEIADDKSEEGSIRAAYNTEEEQRKIAEIILQCFDDKDSETFKSLFCERSQASPDLDEQIQTAFDFYEGKLVSYDDTRNITTYNAKKHTQKHGITSISASGHIRDIITTAEKQYTIAFYNYLLSEYNDRKGISQIVVTVGDMYDHGEQCFIGELIQ